MWQVVLWVNPVTVTAFLFVLLVPGVVFRLISFARPEVIRRGAGGFLMMWIGLIFFVTLASSGSGGGQEWSWRTGIDALLTDDPTRVSESEKSMVIRQWTANFLMFVPIPTLLALWSSFERKVFLRGFFIGVCLSALVETLQWIQGAGRVPDLDDFIFNSLGCAAGVGVAMMVMFIADLIRGERVERRGTA